MPGNLFQYGADSLKLAAQRQKPIKADNLHFSLLGNHPVFMMSGRSHNSKTKGNNTPTRATFTITNCQHRHS
jgi:hypothetical protein